MAARRPCTWEQRAKDHAQPLLPKGYGLASACHTDQSITVQGGYDCLQPADKLAALRRLFQCPCVLAGRTPQRPESRINPISTTSRHFTREVKARSGPGRLVAVRYGSDVLPIEPSESWNPRPPSPSRFNDTPTAPSQRCLRIFRLNLEDPVVPIKMSIFFNLFILHVIYLRKSTGSGFLVRSEGGHPRFITLITPKHPARRPVPPTPRTMDFGAVRKEKPLLAVPSPPGASYSSAHVHSAADPKTMYELHESTKSPDGLAEMEN